MYLNKLIINKLFLVCVTFYFKIKC